MYGPNSFGRKRDDCPSSHQIVSTEMSRGLRGANTGGISRLRGALPTVDKSPFPGQLLGLQGRELGQRTPDFPVTKDDARLAELGFQRLLDAEVIGGSVLVYVGQEADLSQQVTPRDFTEQED